MMKEDALRFARELQKNCNAAIQSMVVLWRIACLSIGVAVGLFALLVGLPEVALWAAGLAGVAMAVGTLISVLAALIVAAACIAVFWRMTTSEKKGR